MKKVSLVEEFAHVWLPADVAHLGTTATRHLVAAVDLGEGSLATMAVAHLCHRHLLLAAKNTKMVQIHITE